MSDWTKFPTQPGVYLHKDAQGEIIYIGKAKNLRKRIVSYFQKRELDPKTTLLVKQIIDTEVIVTHNEIEALLLENRLIKQHRPRFNIQLKDNQRYWYVRITKEPFPQVLAARRTNKKDRFLGPFTYSVRSLIKIAHESFNIRRCSTIKPGGCLYYHVNLCSGVCAGKVEQETYQQWVRDFIHFVQHGDNTRIVEYQRLMKESAALLAFEKAQEYKKRIELLEQIRQKQIVDKFSSYDQDIVGIATQGTTSCISLLKMKRGVMMHKDNFTFVSSDELLNEFLKIYYSTYMPPHEIIVEGEYDPTIAEYLQQLSGKSVSIIVPKHGIKKELLDLAKKNAYAHFSLEDPVLIELKEMLKLDQVPLTIDCFDISNYGATVVVGACVQYKKRQPNKGAWRLYNIKGDFGQDDFRSMQEVLLRRYSALALPDLIIIDGGPVQVDFAQRALTALNLNCSVIGLAKEEETVIFPDGRRLVLNRKLASAKLIIAMRDAVHRFAITHSRRRFKSLYKHSVLDEITGIGDITKFKLLREFGSIERISQASFDELARVVGRDRAEKIVFFFST